MAHYIDAMGKACPQPVILTKQALDEGKVPLTIAVDNTIAVENLRRLAANRSISATVQERDGRYEVTFSQAGEAAASACCLPASGSYAVLIAKDKLGDGDATLGFNLLKMFLYTLSQSDDVPAALLFMNSGVKLVAGGEADVIASVNALIEKGCNVLVCGTCLNFYGLGEALQAGTVSNMYDIVGQMQQAGKVISL